MHDLNIYSILLHVAFICNLLLVAARVLDWYNPYMDFAGTMWPALLVQTAEEVCEPVPLREIVMGGLRILPDSWHVYREDQEIRLTNKEFEILRFLAQNPNIVFSRDQLMNEIWGYDYVGDTTTVMVHINRLRDKIELDPGNPQIIETIWGAGYRLNT